MVLYLPPPSSGCGQHLGVGAEGATEHGQDLAIGEALLTGVGGAFDGVQFHGISLLGG
ncbi:MULTISPECIES: hypothetical protein [unclassified Streptomyces]|uniref:hypothetical protein n=1 Tax=unclassified Streptomyces TaxID=2593676 RepID=UPI00225A155F|nr:hypothetical protein [Streptomyces sp. NBC_00047]MCX5613096.1 hypothetical protein [Streptomyces sp. NBC_00047]